MRFVCSLCVILHHSFQYLTTYPYLNHTHVVVDFFIMLGGFVATNADEPKLESERITFRDFVRHRFLRLFPLMSVGVFLGSVFFILTHHDFRLPLIAFVFAYAVLNLLLIPRIFGDYYIKKTMRLFRIRRYLRLYIRRRLPSFGLGGLSGVAPAPSLPS
ncbi:acyltransferase [Acetobacter sp. DsW_063]|uniref:acyltransferase family protein n=1 Tax=Acetobacter sp. DsW_063 TaxID=1514894 RepID=UPI000A37BCFC|nr:hypothetical protein HK28_01080 [Acetobacter sp. DsW_063]